MTKQLRHIVLLPKWQHNGKTTKVAMKTTTLKAVYFRLFSEYFLSK